MLLGTLGDFLRFLSVLSNFSLRLGSVSLDQRVGGVLVFRMKGWRGPPLNFDPVRPMIASTAIAL
jgi:hypothetical protein